MTNRQRERERAQSETKEVRFKERNRKKQIGRKEVWKSEILINGMNEIEIV